MDSRWGTGKGGLLPHRRELYRRTSEGSNGLVRTAHRASLTRSVGGQSGGELAPETSRTLPLSIIVNACATATDSSVMSAHERVRPPIEMGLKGQS